MEKSGSEKTYPSRRRACYQSVTGSGRFLIDKEPKFRKILEDTNTKLKALKK
ncbi:MAG: hypothetical protein ACOCQG_03050 [Candidatus Nanoarchaeia archaeon]